MRALLTTTVVVLAVASVSAHIMVSPPESKTGVTQKYELRVHNEEKLSIAEVVLDIPGGITVLSIGTAPAGTYTTSKTGDRSAVLTWKVAVQPGKYLACRLRRRTRTLRRKCGGLCARRFRTVPSSNGVTSPAPRKRRR